MFTASLDKYHYAERKPYKVYRVTEARAEYIRISHDNSTNYGTMSDIQFWENDCGVKIAKFIRKGLIDV